MQRVALNFRLPVDVTEAIRAASRRTGSPIQDVLENAVRAYLPEEDFASSREIAVRLNHELAQKVAETPRRRPGRPSKRGEGHSDG